MPAQVDDSPRDWMTALWMAPFTIGMALWQGTTALTEAWAKTVFEPAHRHPHDSHSDLEVPDPIEEDGEHDLFA